MKYTVQSSKYVLKNFIYLFPFAILPAIFLSASTDEGAIASIIKAVFAGDISTWSFGALFRAISVLNFASWKSVVFGIVGIIWIVPCVALLMALLEKHMRIGKRTYNGLWNKLNDNFNSTCSVVITVVIAYEIWTLLLAAFLFFLSRIPIAAVAYVFTILAFIAFHVVLMVSIGAIYLWLPCMQITGFRLFEALHYSYHLMSPIKWKIMLSQIAVLLSVEALICACSMFVVSPVVFRVVVAVLYACVLMIYCVRMQVAYFDRDNIERADTAKYY